MTVTAYEARGVPPEPGVEVEPPPPPHETHSITANRTMPSAKAQREAARASALKGPGSRTLPLDVRRDIRQTSKASAIKPMNATHGLMGGVAGGVGPRGAASEGAIVVTLTVTFCALDPLSETDLGVTEQTPTSADIGQFRATVWVNAPSGATVTV